MMADHDHDRIVQVVAELRANELLRALRHAVAGAAHWRLQAQVLLRTIDAGLPPEPAATWCADD